MCNSPTETNGDFQRKWCFFFFFKLILTRIHVQIFEQETQMSHRRVRESLVMLTVEKLCQSELESSLKRQLSETKVCEF